MAGKQNTTMSIFFSNIVQPLSKTTLTSVLHLCRWQWWCIVLQVQKIATLIEIQNELNSVINH